MPGRTVTAILLLVGAAGCGSKDIAPVSGVVTLNGKPVAEVAVSFQPVPSVGKTEAGPASFGVTSVDGRYTLKLMDKSQAGAAVGKNQVRFSAYVPPTGDPNSDAPNKAKPSVQIPARYWNDSKIDFDVPAGGTSAADFALKSP